MKALPIHYDESIPAWEKAIYAFLAEKERRSGYSDRQTRNVSITTDARKLRSTGRHGVR